MKVLFIAAFKTDVGGCLQNDLTKIYTNFINTLASLLYDHYLVWMHKERHL